MDKTDSLRGFLIYTDKPVIADKKVIQLSTGELTQLPEQQPTVQEDLPEHIMQLEQKFKEKLIKDFAPIFLTQFEGEACMEYESFDRCVDEYFSQLDKQREQSKFQSKEDDIWKKMGRIRED